MIVNSTLREELNGLVANSLASWRAVNKLKTTAPQHKQLTDSLVIQLEALIQRKQVEVRVDELKKFDRWKTEYDHYVYGIRDEDFVDRIAELNKDLKESQK